MTPRLQEKYRDTLVPELLKEFNRRNIMEVPRLEKIVLNMGVGDANQEPRYLETAEVELATITGQKPSIRRARKSISNFKLRQGQPIGVTVTLRGHRMYEFIDRLFNVAMPRIRDFRGVPQNSFDKQFNYTLGLKEQTIFPELNMDAVIRVRGMNITFVVKNARSREETYALLLRLGMPFRGATPVGASN
ncbi:MAG: 50S ribosomal protein L5 [Candidatus Hydrogenedentales bacterium]